MATFNGTLKYKQDDGSIVELNPVGVDSTARTKANNNATVLDRVAADLSKEITDRNNADTALDKRVKKLEPASLGKNAGFLLLLGDDEENLAVERWARQCLNLPMVW